MDFLGQDQSGGEQKDTTLDYLGRSAPVAFKNQPALPGGGGAIGVGAGPSTTSTGIAAPVKVRSDALGGQDFTDFLTAFAGSQSGGAESGSDPGAAGGVAPGITGFDPSTGQIAINTAVNTLGAPGLIGLLGSIFGMPGLAQGVPGFPGLGGLAGKGIGAIAGLGPSNLTQQTNEGPINVSPTFSSLLGALANVISGFPNFAGVDPSTGQITTAPPAQSLNPSQYTGLGMNQGFGVVGHPAFGFAGFNAPSQTPSDPSIPGFSANARGSEGLSDPGITGLGLDAGVPGTVGTIGDTGITSGDVGEGEGEGDF